MLLAFGDFPEQLTQPCTNTSLVLTCSALVWWHLPICEGLGLCHPLKATHLRSCLDSAYEQQLCLEWPQAGKGTSPPTQEKKKNLRQGWPHYPVEEEPPESEGIWGSLGDGDEKQAAKAGSWFRPEAGSHNQDSSWKNATNATQLGPTNQKHGPRGGSRDRPRG